MKAIDEAIIFSPKTDQSTEIFLQNIHPPARSITVRQNWSDISFRIAIIIKIVVVVVAVVEVVIQISFHSPAQFSRNTNTFHHLHASEMIANPARLTMRFVLPAGCLKSPPASATAGLTSNNIITMLIHGTFKFMLHQQHSPSPSYHSSMYRLSRTASGQTQNFLLSYPPPPPPQLIMNPFRCCCISKPLASIATRISARRAHFT